MTARAFAIGDQVRLTDRYELKRSQRAHPRVNWRERRGIVSFCSAITVWVRWKGRKSSDTLPIGAVQKYDYHKPRKDKRRDRARYVKSLTAPPTVLSASFRAMDGLGGSSPVSPIWTPPESWKSRRAA